MFGFLKNFRRGFATNSSSSHSFVYLKEPVPEHDKGDAFWDNEFGWHDFRLDTLKEKLFYVLVGRIGGGWRVEDREPVDEVYARLGDEFPELDVDDFAYAQAGYVDHESVGTIGVGEARDPHVVVFGGNDNDGDSAERARVVRAGLVDWSKTVIYQEDGDNLAASDVEGRTKYYSEFPWMRENVEGDVDEG